MLPRTAPPDRPVSRGPVPPPGEDDDCVKLYDLSSLLESRFEGVGRDDNPFSGHVALLLYR